MEIKPYFRLNKSKNGVYDIELQNITELKKYSSIESHILIYPLSRDINADNISCNPFEEYANDVKCGEVSTYSKINFAFNKILGILLGLIILIIFLFVAPQAFLSIDSVVAIFAAYIVGKELGEDLEFFLINISSNWRLQFYRDYFQYRVERATTLTNYTRVAKKYRYGAYSILPTGMGFDKRSNSQIVRLKFKKTDFSEGDSSHILSLKVDDNLAKIFEKEGYLIGFKLCLNKNYFFFSTSTEVFQAVCNKVIGCLGRDDKILKDSLSFRNVIKFGRIKYHSKSKIIGGEIISIKN